jgi:N-hydroxyarylamine O-acetyltransferase
VIAALLRLVGLDGAPPAPTAAGLRSVHRAFLERVPYEDLAVQLGECGALDEAALVERMLAGGRGGYCFELNTVFAVLLRGLGFAVAKHEAVVGGAGPTNHMALVAEADGEPWLADAGFGEGFVDPLPLRPGRHAGPGPFAWTLEREPGGAWWLGQHEWGSTTGFRMAAAPSPPAAFEPHHRRLSSDPASPFVQTLVAQMPGDDRITTLRSRTLSVRGPEIDSKRLLRERDELAATLRDVFGIDPAALGGARLERLWERAAAQHAAFAGRAA